MTEDFRVRHPIQILMKLFQDEDMQDVVDAMLRDITEHLVTYVYTMYSTLSKDDPEYKSLESHVNNLFELIDGHQKIVWSSLATLLRD